MYKKVRYLIKKSICHDSHEAKFLLPLLTFHFATVLWHEQSLRTLNIYLHCSVFSCIFFCPVYVTAKFVAELDQLLQDSVERNGWAVRSLKNKFFKSFTERQIGNDEDFQLLAATHVVSISSKLIPNLT